MRPPAIMIQGTGSNVGKSLIVAGLCRAFADRGFRVAPFKPQNMSNNAGVAADRGEIGRAQMLQARAARVPASVHMNPVLLKPESDIGAQVIVQGRRWATLKAGDYTRRKGELLPHVLDSLCRLEAGSELILVEGAGSPAETNLRQDDIANMGFAAAADMPVVLVGDIDRGGVIASLAGTHTVLAQSDRERIKGFIINRFRGDPKLFEGGVREIVERTGWASLGVVPFFEAASKLPAEDVLDLRSARRGEGRVLIAVPRLPHIANFDDLDPLNAEPDVEVLLVEPGQPLPGDCDVVLLPGSKSTMADLAAIRREGWDIDIMAHRRRGGMVVGLCGGFQMLGRTIGDPQGIEGPVGSMEGLGLLAVDTVLGGDKTTLPICGVHLESREAVAGYEIHFGRTEGPDCARPLLDIEGRTDGAMSADGRVVGTYVHGLFAADGFRRVFLRALGASSSAAYDIGVETALDGLAAHLAAHLDLDRILTIARSRAR